MAQPSRPWSRTLPPRPWSRTLPPSSSLCSPCRPRSPPPARSRRLSPPSRSAAVSSSRCAARVVWSLARSLSTRRVERNSCDARARSRCQRRSRARARREGFVPPRVFARDRREGLARRRGRPGYVQDQSRAGHPGEDLFERDPRTD